ncbi:MAG: T9SS type A sorting domain-containing protein [Bacteroidota bacterium]|nr:T9SS type A sorting domain-containing protein [Bacteroidota bacterium]
MKKLILILLLVSASVYSQDNLVGKKEVTGYENGSLQKKTILNPLPNSGHQVINQINNSSQPLNPFNNTNIRWSYTEPAAIGDYCFTSGNGKYNVVGWDLNNHRVTLSGNLNSTPIWEFTTSPDVFINFVTISDTGGVVGVGSLYNIYMFNKSSNVPFFNFDLTLLPDTGFATSLDVTKDGKFLVGSVSRQDSSTIYGFNSNSNVPFWKLKIVPAVATGGASIQGVKISGNDSLVIVNTYAEFFVIKTYTGDVVYRGLINPFSPSSGTQATQGISGDGSIIATINYSGFLRVYQWNGTTYNFLWQNQEPPGMFFNWYASVDISYDGENIAAGTLNFITSSTYDGKVKVFKRSAGGTPFWVYGGCGHEVSALSFSKNGKILSASSWGEFNNLTNDLYIFKTFLGNIPIFTINTPGSLFYCNTSNNGRTVVTSGKAVHANQFGNGGLMYNIEVDTDDVPLVGIHSNNLSVNEYRLYQNYPNPFNPNTVISYQLTVSNYTNLKVFDILGNEVALLVNEKQNAGNYSIDFNAGNLSSGIYFYKLIAGNYSETKSMILLK